MRAEDLELLDKLQTLDPASARDLDCLLDILLRQNSLESAAGLNWAKIGATAEQFGWPLDDLQQFLCGTKSDLISPAARVRNILTTPNFCLMLWYFARPCRLVIPAEIFQPFSFYLIAGNGEIVAATEGETGKFRVRPGELFQLSHAHRVECRFGACSEALFFDFPPFRQARKSLRRLARSRPLPPTR